jgi:hypothetical protein
LCQRSASSVAESSSSSRKTLVPLVASRVCFPLPVLVLGISAPSPSAHGVSSFSSGPPVSPLFTAAAASRAPPRVTGKRPVRCRQLHTPFPRRRCGVPRTPRPWEVRCTVVPAHDSCQMDGRRGCVARTGGCIMCGCQLAALQQPSYIYVGRQLRYRRRCWHVLGTRHEALQVPRPCPTFAWHLSAACRASRAWWLRWLCHLCHPAASGLWALRASPGRLLYSCTAVQAGIAGRQASQASEPAAMQAARQQARRGSAGWSAVHSVVLQSPAMRANV